MPQSVRSLAEAERYGNACYWADAAKLTAEEARHASALLEALGEGCGQSAAAKELGRLKVLTRERNLSHDDLVAQIAIYVEELAGYPIDVVRAACRGWAAIEKWFPAWAELRVLCDERVANRRNLLGAVNRRPETTADVSKGESHAELTPDEQQAHDERMAKLRRNLGTTTKPMPGVARREGPPPATPERKREVRAELHAMAGTYAEIRAERDAVIRERQVKADLASMKLTNNKIQEKLDGSAADDRARD